MSTVALDLDHLRRWVGRVRTDQDVAALRHARLMAATLGSDPQTLREGDPLPLLWHWLYGLEGLPPNQLGPDGHPARGGFLPPVPLPNRMWAGGRVRFEAPIVIGAEMEKRSEVLHVAHKHGRSGELVFVTVGHEVFCHGRRCVSEEQDIVYRSAPAAAGSPTVAERPPPSERHRVIHPDATLLFRYSALTFNGHRIHYDADHCRSVEGYANLVVHGPLLATLLADLAQQHLGRPLALLSYRGVRPTLLGDPVGLHAKRTPQGVAAWSALADGGVSMHLEAA